MSGLVTDTHDDGPWGRATAVFSADRRYRYALTRRWDDDLPLTAFVMLNPSTADAFVLDPTVRRCVGFARDWGSGGLLVLNAFALRSTDPRALYVAHGAVTAPVGTENDAVIDAMLEACQPAQVVAAWGAHAAKINALGQARPRPGSRRLWLSRHEALLDRLGDRLLALHVNRDGTPKHPLYVSADTRPMRYPPLRPVAKAVYAAGAGPESDRTATTGATA